MRTVIGLLSVALAPSWAQIARPMSATPPAAIATPHAITDKRIAPQSFSELEDYLDRRLSTTGGANDPIDLLGRTRALYLDGYGVVFSAEASLAVTPRVNPFRQEITKEDAVRVHKRKVEHLPLLRQAMKEFMRASAGAMVQLPDTQQIVLAVRLLYVPWEDTSGLPAQILMRADRKSALAGDIKTEEQ